MKSCPFVWVGRELFMFWKYIEKINWRKVIQHFLGMKNKELDIQLVYIGENAFRAEWNWDRYCCHAGVRVEIEILGVEFLAEIYDYRHWNYAEGRFYYDEEPELSWIGYKGYTEIDYWQDIENTAKIYHLDEDYCCRCQAVFMEDKEKNSEESRKREEELYAEFRRRVSFRMQSIDWSLVKYAREPGKRRKKQIRQVKGSMLGIKEWRIERKLPMALAFILLDLYDENDNLISRASDCNKSEEDSTNR